MLRTAPAMETLKSVWTDLDLRPFYYIDTPSNEPVPASASSGGAQIIFSTPKKGYMGGLGTPF